MSSVHQEDTTLQVASAFGFAKQGGQYDITESSYRQVQQRYRRMQ